MKDSRTFVRTDWEYGNCTVCVLGYGFQIKAPWNIPLFSERYGYRTKLPLGFGWRILAFKLRPVGG